MKVLIVHDYGALLGGAEIVQLALRDGLRSLGHDVRLFASSAVAFDVDLRPEYECFGTVSSFRTLVQTANPMAARALSRAIDDFRPDVVHVGMFLTQLSPLVLRPLARVAAVYHVHWLRPLCPTGLKILPDGTACHSAPGAVCWREGCVPARDWPPLMLQMRLWRRWAGAFDAIVANSEFTRRRLVDAGIEPVELIYYDIGAAPERPPLGPAPRVAFAGRLVREKGVDVLLSAFAAVAARVPDARLVVAGDGPERRGLERLAADLGIAAQVEWLGHVSRDEVERAFATAWVQVVPSRFDEPFGLVAAEAMARGTALVASAAGGLVEIALDAARLVPAGDAGALGGALLELLTDIGEAERLGRLGRESVRARFGGEHIAGAFVALYERILATRRAHGRH